MAEPIQVYPPPDGGANANSYAPSHIGTAAASIASGAAAVVTAAAGSGTAPDSALLLWFQNVQSTSAGFLGIHSADGSYVFWILVFGSLSVVLATINLVRGLQMKSTLVELSRKANELCKSSGLF